LGSRLQTQTLFQLDELASVAAPNDEARVRSEALETNYVTTDAKTSALRIAKVLLLRDPRWEQAEVDFPNRTDTLVERRIESLIAEGRKYRAVILTNWLTAFQSDLSLYALFAYNSRHGNSQRLLETLLNGEKQAPPYLRLVMLNILKQAIGLSHEELHCLTAGPFDDMAPWVNRMLRDEAVFDWLGRKKRPIRFYGGMTNTVLGLYDELLDDPDVGAGFFNRAADARIDLGGGFSTSELERLLGCSFVSADLLTPRLRDYDDDLVILERRSGSTAVIGEERRKLFLGAQDRIRHIPFDVFKDRLPRDAESYAVVSAGFMTSTLGPFNGESKDVKSARLGTISTSVHAAYRVVELAATGRDVDLFAIQRATSRAYKYKTCLLQWRQGRLSRLQTTDDAKGSKWGGGWTGVYEKINPGNTRYAGFLD
jgi:hypothetical protein